MTKKTTFRMLALASLLLITINTQFSTAHAQGTAFTYQGRLNDGANPATGSYDLRFSLFDAPTVGTQQGGLLTNAATGITNGLFTVTLDFGSQFPGAGRWIEIGVRTNGGGSFLTLSPRQAFTPAPYAITAGNVVSGGLASGTYGSAVVLSNAANQFNGSFTGNGANVTNVNAAKLGGVPLAAFWQTGGNLGTSPGVNILGSLDNQPLELWVNGFRAFKIIPGTNSTANLVGGSGNNAIDSGVTGAVIAGGGGGPVNDQYYFNNIHANYSTIGGGTGNTASNLVSTVAGGFRNTASGPGSFVGGGGYDGLTFVGNAANGGASTVGGGVGNTAATEWSTVGGGLSNYVGATGGFIGGGNFNDVFGSFSTVSGGAGDQAYGAFSTVGGGYDNFAAATGSFIGGGGFNDDSADGNYAGGICSTVAGGWGNTANGDYSMIPGGSLCTTVGKSSFAAGYHAVANHLGSFVWADDSSTTDFTDGADHQFVIRAAGGVGIGTGSPETPLHIADYHGLTLGTSATVGGYTALRMDLSAAQNGYAELQAISQAGTSYGNLILQANGGNVGIGTTTPAQKLTVNGNIVASGTVNGSSDRNVKEHFSPVSPRDVLEKVSTLPISEWNYKADSETLRHIGPMAQDFYATFNVGMDDKHISMVDADGVELAAIKGLNEKLDETRVESKAKDAEIQTLQQQNKTLGSRLDTLEALVKQLAANK